MDKQHFDMIVVGGGHAGVEAALACARMGAQTLLLTHSIDTIGQMSCNPAIGGIGKSHLTREVDALGGVMARAADKAAIQIRVLNASKGPAVRATRVQADRQLYKAAIQQFVSEQDNCFIFQAGVEDLIIENDAVKGVVTSTGIQFFASAVILTTGTFLGGIIHVGMKQSQGGRAGCPPANGLAQRLRALPLRVGRLKTGTPPRLDKRTVDLASLAQQHSDYPLNNMSVMSDGSEHPQQIPCYITHTNDRTHQIIRDHLHESALFSGNIVGRGPRYCPSVEDKIHRFADKDAHQIFVEPEGLTSNELYPNGMSTSLPYEVQTKWIRTIKGFENAHIVRPGYAIEYDFFDPRDLKQTLETQYIENLFFAGQINGTTGYEEAAAQGIYAGINAVLKIQQKPPFLLTRDEAYIGVLIDDLMTQGAPEPYRMFTSRAEYRLLLREDNADLRLTEKGHAVGVVSDVQYQSFINKKQSVERELIRLKKTFVHPDTEQAKALEAWIQHPIAREYSLADLIIRPELDYQKIMSIPGLQQDALTSDAALQVETQLKYAGYIDRQMDEIEKHKRHEQTRLPETLDYLSIKSLSAEVQEKLANTRPHTIGQASRIPGVTPAAISILLVHLKKMRHLEELDA